MKRKPIIHICWTLFKNAAFYAHFSAQTWIDTPEYLSETFHEWRPGVAHRKQKQKKHKFMFVQEEKCNDDERKRINIHARCHGSEINVQKKDFQTFIKAL